MKKLRYIFLLIIAGGVLFSCVEDGDSLADEIEATPNLVGFDRATQAMSAVTDGKEYDFQIPMKVFGPTTTELTGSVQVTVSVDESSTAIEGTHYTLASKELTLSNDGDFLGTLPIKMITEGIDAPLAENPKLVLNVTQVSGNPKVIASGKQIVITLFYLCYTDMSGTYLVTNDVCDSEIIVEITQNPDGSWHLTSADGGFLGNCTVNAGLDNYGNIVELCGVIQPTDDLQYGSLDIGTITGGTWDAEAGVLILHHKQSFSSNWGTDKWTSTYVRQ